MAHETILQQNIVLNVVVNNWQQALEAAGKLLVTNCFTTEQYTQDMIDAVKEYGPYIVVAPDIALGHTRPSSRVLKTGISLVILATPINFGSYENDPVYAVLVLCATNNTDHIQMLTQICTFLDQDCEMQLLTNSQYPSALALAINTFKQKESL